MALKATTLTGIFIGGGAGALCRFALSNYAMRFMGSYTPGGTMTANILGSFLIGVVWKFFQSSPASPDIKLMIITGFLGGFTTFSSFSLESVHLLQSAQYRLCALTIILTQTLCISATLAGISVGSIFVSSR